MLSTNTHRLEKNLLVKVQLHSKILHPRLMQPLYPKTFPYTLGKLHEYTIQARRVARLTFPNNGKDTLSEEVAAPAVHQAPQVWNPPQKNWYSSKHDKEWTISSFQPNALTCWIPRNALPLSSTTSLFVPLSSTVWIILTFGRTVLGLAKPVMRLIPELLLHELHLPHASQLVRDWNTCALIQVDCLSLRRLKWRKSMRHEDLHLLWSTAPPQPSSTNLSSTLLGEILGRGFVWKRTMRYPHLPIPRSRNFHIQVNYCNFPCFTVISYFCSFSL